MTSLATPSRHRRDIEGLRAVAILAVVAYHTGLRVPGGYVGVDVFFVISGFLITQLLWREVNERGTVSFTGFYGRRVRRLLPSAALVIVVTVAASAVLLPYLEAVSVSKDGVASALYVANYRFAAQATNYLSAHGPVSPLQNFWSLGVEEQFYLVWPALLLGLTGAAALFRSNRRAARHRRPMPPTATVAVGLGVLAAGSFALSLHLTRVDQPWAFFSLPTRAWELAVGGLLALAVPRLRGLGPRAAGTLGWAGLGAIATAAFAFTASTPFPGWAALLPVAGSAAILAAGCGPGRLGPARALSVRPMMLVGAVSYTWYLWHWPALILAPSVLGHPLRLDQAIAVSGLSFGLALLTTVLLEGPVRRAHWLSRLNTRSLVLGATLSLGAAAMAALVVVDLPAPVGRGHAAVSHLDTPSVARDAGASAPDSTALAATTEAQATALDAQVNSLVNRSLAVAQVPDNLTPTLAEASGDVPFPFDDGCFDSFTDISVHPCNYADIGSPHTVVLFGDSHALQWFPAIDNLANQKQWHLVVMAKATCPPIDIEVFSPDLGAWYTECDEWKAAELQRMAALRPAVVIIGFSREYGISDDHVEVDGTAWLSGLAQMITTIRGTGADVVLMGDDPYPQQVVPDCLAQNLSDDDPCKIPKRYPYYNPEGIPQEESVASTTGAGYVDTDPWFCGATTCTPIVGNILVYRDDNHISATYASWLTPAIGAKLAVATKGLF